MNCPNGRRAWTNGRLSLSSSPKSRVRSNGMQTSANGTVVGFHVSHSCVCVCVFVCVCVCVCVLGRSARHYLESSRSRSDLKQHRKTNEQRALERRAQRRDQVPAYTKVRPAKLASWRKPKQRAQRDPLLQAALRASKSAPILAPTYHKVPQPVGLSSRGIRSGMLRSLKLGASPESHERRRSQHHGPRRGAADLLPQEKAALQKLPVLPTGSMHVSVVPVLDG